MTTTSLKALVQGAYDLQQIRIQAGNRICQAYYQAHGVKPGEKPAEQMEAEEKRLLDRIKNEYKSMAEGLAKRRKKDQFTPTPYMPEPVILQLVEQYLRIEPLEGLAFKHLERAVEDVPIHGHFLKSVKGCGPAMSSVIISTLDPHKARHPSQFWAAAGLDVVVADGRGRSRRKEHLVTRTYTSRKGTQETRLGITFNAFLKTKLMGVLAPCFLKNNNPYYKGIYDNYKHRLENHPKWKETTKGHRHYASMRYMVKWFLVDLWREWRALEGLPVTPIYAEGKLGGEGHYLPLSTERIAAE